MKNIVKSVLVFVSIILFSVSCNEEYEKFSYVMEGTDLGGVMPKVTFQTPKIFDVADKDNTTLEFIMDVAVVGQFSAYREVVISKSFNGGEPIEHIQIPSAQIPMNLVISIADALQGFDVTPAEVTGGDYIDWTFMIEFDDPDIKFNDDALSEAFPDFRSYFASSLEDAIEGTYTATLLSHDFEGIIPDETIEGYQVTVVPGTGRSQFTLQDVSMNAIPKTYSFIPQLSNTMFYLGSGKFVLARIGAAGGYQSSFPVSATAELTDNGEIIANVTFLTSFLGGNNLSFKLTPN